MGSPGSPSGTAEILQPEELVSTICLGPLHLHLYRASKSSSQGSGLPAGSPQQPVHSDRAWSHRLLNTRAGTKGHHHTHPASQPVPAPTKCLLGPQTREVPTQAQVLEVAVLWPQVPEVRPPAQVLDVPALLQVASQTTQQRVCTGVAST